MPSLLFLTSSSWSRALDKEPLRLAIADLAATHGEYYPKAKEYLDRLERDADEDAFTALLRKSCYPSFPGSAGK